MAENYGEIPEIGGIYGFTRGISKWILEKFYNINFVGFENVPTNNEPLIIVSNHDTPNESWHFEKRRGEIVPHTHSVDHLLIGMFLRQKIHAVASTKHYDNRLRRCILNILEQVPASPEGIGEAKEFLDRGDSIMIFPEGNSGQGTILGKPVKYGWGLGSLVETYPTVRVLPTYVRIQGKKDGLLPKFDWADVVFGEPFVYGEEFDSLPREHLGKVDHEKISEEIMRRKIMPLEERVSR